MQQKNHVPYDLIILGGGSGGLTAARLGVALGAKTLLIDKKRLGGECLYTGCIPSKSLIHAARLVHQARQAQRFSKQPLPFELDMERVASSIQETIERVHELEGPFVEGAMVRFGHATFQSPTTLLLDGESISGSAIVIATGSRPAIPAIPGLEEVAYFTNDTIFDLTRLPASLAILGGGPVGVELGQAFARLGSRVTIIQRAERLLPREDPDVSVAIASALQADGVNILTRAQVVRISKQGAECVLTVRQGENESQITSAALLLATGRKANVEDLQLDAAGIAYNEQGIVVDPFLHTSAPSVFAIGDVIGGARFTHVAASQAGVAVRNALVPVGKQRHSTRAIPWCTFTDPEAGRVGLTPAEAEQRYDKVRVVKFPYAQIDRAQTDESIAGFLKLVLAGKREEIVGAHLVGAHVGELLGEIVLAMRHHLPLADLLPTVHPYPTLSTGLQQLAFEAYLQGDSAQRDRNAVQGLRKLSRSLASILPRSSPKKGQP